MFDVFLIIAPVVSLVALGFGLGRGGFFPQGGTATLNKFMLFIAVPAMLFHTSAREFFKTEMEGGILIAYYGAGLAFFFLGRLFGKKVFALGSEEASVQATAMVFANVVLIGIPVVQGAFGQAGLVPAMTVISLNVLILFTLPSVLIDLNRAQAGTVGAGMIAKRTLRAVVTNPLILAIASGTFVAWLGHGLWQPIDAVVGLLARAAAPVGLIAVGATLAAHHNKGHLPQSLSIALVKLALMPGTFWLLGHYVFDLSPLWLAVGTVVAGLPVGINPYILATRYDVYVKEASAAFLTTSCLAAVTVPIIILLVRP